MVIVITAFGDVTKRSAEYWKFEGPDCIARATKCYQHLLEDAMLTIGKEPRVISTHINLDA